jgi:hypothetical protein
MEIHLKEKQESKIFKEGILGSLNDRVSRGNLSLSFEDFYLGQQQKRFYR